MVVFDDECSGAHEIRVVGAIASGIGFATCAQTLWWCPYFATPVEARHIYDDAKTGLPRSEEEAEGRGNNWKEHWISNPLSINNKGERTC
jgi:hypothetical protein